MLWAKVGIFNKQMESKAIILLHNQLVLKVSQFSLKVFYLKNSFTQIFEPVCARIYASC